MNEEKMESNIVPTTNTIIPPNIKWQRKIPDADEWSNYGNTLSEKIENVPIGQTYTFKSSHGIVNMIKRISFDTASHSMLFNHGKHSSYFQCRRVNEKMLEVHTSKLHDSSDESMHKIYSKASKSRTMFISAGGTHHIASTRSKTIDIHSILHHIPF